MTPNQINHNPESQHEGSVGHKTNHLKSIARKDIVPVLLIAGAIFTANEVKGQETTWTIDPANNYTMQHPDTLPNLADKSIIHVRIKTGASIPVRIDGMDNGSTIGTVDNSAGDHITPINNITILNKPGTYNRLYRSNGSIKLTTLKVSSIVDSRNETVGSTTKGKRVDVIVKKTNEAWKLNHGNKFAVYQTKNLTTGKDFGVSQTDSIVSDIEEGIIEAHTLDLTGSLESESFDSTLVVNDDNMTLDHVNHKINLTHTVPTAIYKIRTGSSENNMTQVAEIIGDGNPHSIQSQDEKYIEVVVQRTKSYEEEHNPTPVVMAKGKLSYQLRTENEQINVDSKKLDFAVSNRTVYFKEDIKHYQVIDMSGRIIKEGTDNSVSLEKSGVYIMLVEKANGSKVNEKIMIR